MWQFVYDGKTVVYETCEQNLVYVIRPDGSVTLLQGSASIANVSELNVETTIHIFDANTRSNREPARSLAFLIVTSSRNYTSYAQTSRRVDIKKFCIPSYTCTELLRYNDLFEVSPAVVVNRCEEIGPSIRYVLAVGARDDLYQQCKRQTEIIARRVTTDQLESYMDDNSQAGDGDDISACLLIAIVYEENFINAEESYDELNVSWEFGSRHLAKIIMNQRGAKAKSFISHFITDVNKQGITKLIGIAGNFLELIVDEFLVSGKFQKCQRLGEPRNFHHGCESLELWNATLQVEEKSVDIRNALSDCRNADKLYCYCKIFPAVDYSAMDFKFVFQVTNFPAHTVNLEAIRMICNHVRTNYGEQEKVKLMFVVPQEIATNYQYTQSFKFVGVDENGVKRQMQAKFENLNPAIQIELRNLEQWVIYFE